MMNRGVMQRQMFAKGGAAFPDLSGDGRVTQKDILMGRGVPMQQGGNPQMALNDYLGDQTSALAAEAARLGISEEQLLALLNQQAQPQQPVGMAMGGDPAMAQGVASMMPTEMAAAPGMAGAMAAQSDMPSEAVNQAAGAMDPAVLEQMLGTVDENIQNLDGAEDFETVMNSMRGDDASIEERYMELADVVGQEDAAQTPESVLALVQPVMMLNAVDQGIGGLAQEEMTAPVEGAMAEGIMSTVAPPPQEAAPMPPAGMGGPPPVNFKDGGLVRRGDNQPVLMMQEGGDPIAQAGRLGELYQQKMPLYKSILGDPTESLQKQKELTQSQMLFDIANTALAFAAPMEGERRGMSAAERLAMAARTTQLPQTIGARAQAQLDAEKAVTAQEQQMKLSALGAAETGLAAESKAAEALKLQQLEGAQELAKLDRKAVLDLNLQSTLEGLKQAGRIEIKNIEGAQSMSLEELKQSGAISLEDYRQVNRMALDEAQNNNKIAIEQLKASGRQSDLVLAQQLEQENIVLRGNIKLSEMGVANEYELGRMEIGHGYATELQTSQLAVKERIANNRLELETINSALNQARADKELAISQSKLDLAREAEARIADLDTRKLSLEQDKFDFETTLKGLETFGKTGKNKAQSILASPELLKGYAENTLNPAQTLMVNNAIDMLSTRETIIVDGNKVKTGGAIPEGAKQAVIARSGLGVDGISLPRDVSRITAGPIEETPIVSLIMEDVPDATVAFGSDAFLRNAINATVEAVTLGTVDAPYQATDKAINAVKTLNTNTLTHFQKIAELRDSVKLMDRLDQLTADPGALLTGDTEGKNKTRDVMNNIDELLDVLDQKIKNYSSSEPEYNEAVLNKRRALQLRAGFEAIDRAYNAGTASNKIEALRKEIGLD